MDGIINSQNSNQREQDRPLTNNSPQQMYIMGYEAAINKIARQLHDDVCNKLLVLEYQFEEQIPDTLLRELTSIRELIRKISHDLYQPKLDQLALSEIIEMYFAEIDIISTFTLHYFVDKRIDNLNFTEYERIALYRIIQECVTNIMKHAYAKTVQATLFVDKEVMFLILEDDGVGFDQNENTNGLGIGLLTNRAKVLAGSIDISSEPEKGTIVCLNVPL